MSFFRSLPGVVVKDEVEDELPQKEECLGLSVAESGREKPAMLTEHAFNVVLPLLTTVFMGDCGTSIGYTNVDKSSRNWEQNHSVSIVCHSNSARSKLHAQNSARSKLTSERLISSCLRHLYNFIFP